MLLSKFCSRILPQIRHVPRQMKAVSLVGKQPIRYGGGGKKVLNVFITKQGQKDFKRYAMIYTAVGLVPALLIIFYTSYVVGEAELYEYDPEVYEPKIEEFFAHPITRFLAKYVMEDPRLSYYKDIYAIEFESNLKRVSDIVRAVDNIERYDGFKKWNNFENPIHSTRESRELEEYIEEHNIPVDKIAK